MPALLTAQSRWPQRATVVSTMAATSSGRVTSARTNSASPPASSTSAAVSLPPSSFTSAIVTAAPARLSAIADARPRPDPPPVTSAALSSSAPTALRSARARPQDVLRRGVGLDRLEVEERAHVVHDPLHVVLERLARSAGAEVPHRVGQVLDLAQALLDDASPRRRPFGERAGHRV